MKVVFPENKCLIGNKIKNFTIKSDGFIYHEDIDISNPKDNQITINKVDYYFTYLTLDGKTKGGNSIILKLFETQNINEDDIKYETPDLIIKILKYKKQRFPEVPELRFQKEISILNKCKELEYQNIINIDYHGICKIYNPQKHVYYEYLFYTMEYAPFDLKSFIEMYHNTIDLNKKLSYCISISKGLKELYNLGYFHRDIKPDNIFITNDIWKIGDLGLLEERESEKSLDLEAEWVGPRGWMSPESMNKFLTEGKGFENKFNCKIDHQSDIFQLGKVFWYIFQYNAPIGGVKEIDFKIKQTHIYSILKTMLNHSKTKRFKNIDEIIFLLEKIELKLFKSVA